jgi:hypothetical protein
MCAAFLGIDQSMLEQRLAGGCLEALYDGTNSGIELHAWYCKQIFHLKYYLS